MATAAEFEEKEYETLANASFVVNQMLFGGDVRIFSPGQVAEKRLGFDLATRIDPRGRLYRQLFGAAPGAPGISTQAQAGLGISPGPTTRSLNVFLQYKRPHSFGTRHRSTSWAPGQAHLAFWAREKGQTDQERFAQVKTLSQLENDLGASAIVRYACPATWRKQDLYSRFADESLLSTSTFVKPSQLLRPIAPGYHERWRFDPDRPDRGVPNPDGTPQDAMDGDSFVRAVESKVKSPAADFFDESFRLAFEKTRDVKSDLDLLRVRKPKRERDEYYSEYSAVDRELQFLDPFEEGILRAAADVALLAKELRLTWLIAAEI